MTERLPTRLPEVTDRQLEVARLVAAGYTNERIALELGITHDGAKYHVSELLGRLGFERREEIAAWYRAEHGSLAARARRRLRSLTLVPAGLVAGGAVVGVAALVLLFAAFEGALGGESGGASADSDDSSAVLPPGEGERFIIERGAASEVPVAEYVHEHSGDGWETRAAANLGERDLMFLVWHGGLAEIHAIDLDTGERVGEVAVEWDRATVVRFGHRLVVAPSVSGGVDSADDPANILLVFDVNAGLALETVVQAEGLLLSNSTPGVRGPLLVEAGTAMFSRDGRYLYYVAQSEPHRVDLVGAIDLDGGPDMTASAYEVCADGGLFPASASSVLAYCVGDGALRTVGPEGSISSPVDAEAVGGYLHGRAPGEVPTLRDESEGGIPNIVVAAIETAEEIVVVFHEGRIARGGSGGLAVSGNVMPLGGVLMNAEWRGDVLLLEADRIVLGYYMEPPWVGGDTPMPAPAGLVVIDAAHGRVEAVVEIDHWGAYPIGDDRIAIIGQHRIDMLDLGTMQIERSFQLVHPAPIEGAGNLSWNPAVR